MSNKCPYYNEYTWCDPPLEPDENGTLITEYECKKAERYFIAGCNGDKEECNLEDMEGYGYN